VALQRFFTKEHLDVLREIALLQVVEEFEAHRLAAEVLDHQDRLISNVAAEHEHHFLGLVKPDPSANRIVRRGWEMSERLGGRLDLLWMAPSRQSDDPNTDRNVDDLRRLAAVFGAELIVEKDRDIAHAVLRTVNRLGTTHIVMGVPYLRKRLGVPQRSIVDKIVETAPTLQLALVGDLEATRASTG
jgi:two-component system, OmpR family, sensor histidine kinase KdpD